MGIALTSLRLLLPFRAYAAEQPGVYAEEILSVQCAELTVQEWTDHVLTPQIGMSSPDWYVMALSAQGSADLSGYAAAAENELRYGDTVNPVSRERLALTLTACEGPSPVCTEVLDHCAGELGIMSRIFALHLMNNGVQSDTYTAAGLALELTALQAPDGGWSLQGGRGDADVTAMTLQALAPYRDIPEVSPAVQRGIDFLAASQLPSGAYQSYGTENPESTAQVWLALSCLGIDALYDSRFIAGENTLLDGILQFRVSEGQYAHVMNGSANTMATVQVFLALTAADMLQTGAGSFYLFHGASPVWQAAEPPVTQTEPEPAVTSARTARQTTARPSEPAFSAQDSGHSAAVTGTSGSSASGTEPAGQTSAGTASADTSCTTLSSAAEETAAGSVRTTVPAAPVKKPGAKYPYRIPLTAAAAAVFGGITVFFVIRKQKSPKTYLTIATGFCAVTALIWVVRIESPEQFYTPEAHTGGGTVTMEIRCDVIIGLPGSEQYPADGIIMPVTEFSIEPEENALTLLYDAVKADQLQIEVDGVSGDVVETAYVRGIASLYEFDFGDLSGWTYTVNGERPSVGCGACTLHDGDAVAWVYTINL